MYHHISHKYAKYCIKYIKIEILYIYIAQQIKILQQYYIISELESKGYIIIMIRKKIFVPPFSTHLTRHHKYPELEGVQQRWQDTVDSPFVCMSSIYLRLCV